jgi:hypothetical protein
MDSIANKNRFWRNILPTWQHMYLIAIAELAIYSFVKVDLAMTRPRPLPEFLQGLKIADDE